MFGFGPLQDLLRAPTITEIMVVKSDQIYVERDGILELSGRRFLSDKVTESIIERIGDWRRSLIFDVGGFLVVIGLVVAVLRHLGQGLAED